MLAGQAILAREQMRPYQETIYWVLGASVSPSYDVNDEGTGNVKANSLSRSTAVLRGR